MQNRTLENLILENEDYIFEGNLTIEGDVIIKNGNIHVSGTLKFTNANHTATISITNGNISARMLESNADIFIRNGNISVYHLVTRNIDSDGTIEVIHKSDVYDITCFNYLISGNNDSGKIAAFHDVCILGNNDSCHIIGRYVLVVGNCYLNKTGVTAKKFEYSGKLEDCMSITE